ncbi:hypothetical protein HDU76_009476 [Blyttiomyces sp. JEL0837]|nr:hypothetical protein HDU76_009476 [Blyttiomyces sp. JEL0837]
MLIDNEHLLHRRGGPNNNPNTQSSINLSTSSESPTATDNTIPTITSTSSPPPTLPATNSTLTQTTGTNIDIPLWGIIIAIVGLGLLVAVIVGVLVRKIRERREEGKLMERAEKEYYDEGGWRRVMNAGVVGVAGDEYDDAASSSFGTVSVGGNNGNVGRPVSVKSGYSFVESCKPGTGVGTVSSMGVGVSTIGGTTTTGGSSRATSTGGGGGGSSVKSFEAISAYHQQRPMNVAEAFLVATTQRIREQENGGRYGDGRNDDDHVFTNQTLSSMIESKVPGGGSQVVGSGQSFASSSKAGLKSSNLVYARSKSNESSNVIVPTTPTPSDPFADKHGMSNTSTSTTKIETTTGELNEVSNADSGYATRGRKQQGQHGGSDLVLLVERVSEGDGRRRGSSLSSAGGVAGAEGQGREKNYNDEALIEFGWVGRLGGERSEVEPVQSE